MVSSQPEPEWDDEQVDLVVAEDIVSRLTGRHGEWLPDATNDDIADPNNYSGLRYDADPDGPFTNWAEKAYQDAMDALKKGDGNVNGQYITIKATDVRPTTQ